MGEAPTGGHIGSTVIISPEPLRSLIFGLLSRFKDTFRRPFAADGSVETLDIGILLRIQRDEEAIDHTAKACCYFEFGRASVYR